MLLYEKIAKASKLNGELLAQSIGVLAPFSEVEFC